MSAPKTAPKLSIVARQSDGYGDTLFVEDAKGDYPVIRPYERYKRKPFCLVCKSESCRHALAVAQG